MYLQQIHDPALAQYAYLIGCQQTGEALIVDAERDVDRHLELAARHDLRIVAAAETHIHADFLSGTRQLVERHGVHAHLSREGGGDWQYGWARGNGRVRLLGNGDRFSVGKVEISALHTPGHTPEHLSFLVIDRGAGAEGAMALLSGDFVFVGDVGRPDLLESAAGQAGTQEAGARQLFASIREFADLPGHLLLLPGHGAGSSCGRALGAVPFSTTGYELRNSAPIRTAIGHGEQAFVRDILAGQPEPPMYYARMKRTNRDGPPLFDSVPRPPELAPNQLTQLGEDDVCVDLRQDREAFMRAHIRNSLHAPEGPKFTEAIGSYLGPETGIVLLVERLDQVDDCVRQLLRIGMDRVTGYLPVDAALELPPPLVVSTPTIPTTRLDPTTRILDVRSASEYDAGHVPGAINLAHTRLVADRDRLPDPGPLAVHCGTGARAALAAAALERMGFEVTFANGSFADWRTGTQESVAAASP